MNPQTSLAEKAAAWRDADPDPQTRDVAAGLAQLSTAVEQVRKDPPRQLAGQPVTVADLREVTSGVVDLTGGHAERCPGQPLPLANVLIWHVGVDARVMIRPSGTEPELKIYAEAVRSVGSRAKLAGARESTAKQADKMLAAAIAILTSNISGQQPWRSTS
jgi:phosphomannomutase